LGFEEAMDTDVLIVGAGPTGLMLANQLTRRGVRIQIIDRHSGPAQQSRALGVQARTLEIYQHLGIARRAIELGKLGYGANIWARGKHMANVSLSKAGGNETPYPYILVLGQDDNELIMGEKLREFSGSVQWNTELVNLLQGSDNVTATLKNVNGTTQTITAKYVAGCDGSRSIVRELNDIPFPGAPYEHVFFVADVECTGTMIADEINVYLFQAGFHLLFPMRGENHWRIVGILPPELRDKSDLKFEDVIPTLRQEAGSQLTFKSCIWFSTYRIHHRHAARFRANRCFLLGDAAHVHSPVGAQGMNTGLQDAYNLAWKLALVVKGTANSALLDSYEEERLPIAQYLLNTTDRAFRLIVSDTWLAKLFRTKILAHIAAFAMKQKRIQQFVFRRVSQISINYRKSSLSVTEDNLEIAKNAPHAGDRFPWLKLQFESNGIVEDTFEKFDDTKFNLIIIKQPAAVPANSRDGGSSGGRTAAHFASLFSLPDDSKQNFVLRSDYYQEGVHGVFLPGTPEQSAPDTHTLDFGDMLQIHTILDNSINRQELSRVGIISPSFYLVRPDGHIGICGGKFEESQVIHYINERLHIIKRKRCSHEND